jgi:prepilin-type N-terminal cleavage/methylation domain-containing protein
MSKQSKETGFTLIELMIVMSIVAVLAACIIPIWRVYKEKSATAQAQIAGHCLQAAGVGLSTMPVTDREAIIHQMGTSDADFHLATENLGCQTGPTPTVPDSPYQVNMKDCKILICVGKIVVRDTPCVGFDNRSLGVNERTCGMRLFTTQSGYPIINLPFDSE